MEGSKQGPRFKFGPNGVMEQIRPVVVNKEDEQVKQEIPEFAKNLSSEIVKCKSIFIPFMIRMRYELCMNQGIKEEVTSYDNILGQLYYLEGLRACHIALVDIFLSACHDENVKYGFKDYLDDLYKANALWPEYPEKLYGITLDKGCEELRKTYYAPLPGLMFRAFYMRSYFDYGMEKMPPAGLIFKDCYRNMLKKLYLMDKKEYSFS